MAGDVKPWKVEVVWVHARRQYTLDDELPEHLLRQKKQQMAAMLLSLANIFYVGRESVSGRI